MDANENLPEEKPPEPEMTPQRKWLLFAGGFLGWYVVNGLVWFMISGGKPLGYGFFLSVIILPSNAIALLIFAVMRPTRLVALGILTALALNFVVSLMLSLEMNSMCFIPFFIK